MNYLMDLFSVVVTLGGLALLVAADGDATRSLLGLGLILVVVIQRLAMIGDEQRAQVQLLEKIARDR